MQELPPYCSMTSMSSCNWHSLARSSFRNKRCYLFGISIVSALIYSFKGITNYHPYSGISDGRYTLHRVKWMERRGLGQDRRLGDTQLCLRISVLEGNCRGQFVAKTIQPPKPQQFREGPSPQCNLNAIALPLKCASLAGDRSGGRRVMVILCSNAQTSSIPSGPTATSPSVQLPKYRMGTGILLLG